MIVSVGIMIVSVGILIGSVGILIHWYFERWYFERWYFEPLPFQTPPPPLFSNRQPSSYDMTYKGLLIA